jgi:hypothetical protein
MVMTERGYDDPSVRQLTVFLQNRIGQMREALKAIDSVQVVVHALAVQDSADYAVMRVVVDRLDDAARALRGSGFSFTESTVLAVEVPEDRGGLIDVCRALLKGEINIHACYPLLTRPRGVGAAVFHVDGHHAATDLLRRGSFRLLDEKDLQRPS